MGPVDEGVVCQGEWTRCGYVRCRCKMIHVPRRLKQTQENAVGKWVAGRPTLSWVTLLFMSPVVGCAAAALGLEKVWGVALWCFDSLS